MMNRSAIVIAAQTMAIAILLFFLMKQCNKPCPDAVVIKKWTDTIYIKPSDVKPIFTIKVPEAYKIIHRSKNYPDSSLPGVLVSVCGSGSSLPAAFSPCDDVAIYSDTTEEANAYKAIIADTITGNRITGRGITFWNLSPKITEHVEKIIPLKENVRLYAGGFAGFQVNYSTKQFSNWSIGPSLMLTIPQGLAVSYGFDAKNNGHLLNLQYKIKLKK